MAEQPMISSLQRTMAKISWEKDEEVFQTGVENANEETNTYAPGMTCTVLVKKNLYRDKAGKEFLVGVTRDITDRKQAEEALRKSEKMYRLLINNVSESIIVAQDGLLKFVNLATLALLGGYSEQELIDSPFSQFIHPDDRNMVVENYRRLDRKRCSTVPVCLQSGNSGRNCQVGGNQWGLD